MRLLLDTHAFLWGIAEPGRLSPRARGALLDGANHLLLSTASLWEIAIKQSVGRLELRGDWPNVIERERVGLAVDWLTVQPEHCIAASTLAFHHRDPFDRMLVAQASVEDLTLLSADANLRAYAVDVLW